MIIQVNIGESLDKARQLLTALGHIATQSDDLLAPVIKEKAFKASELIIEITNLLNAPNDK